MSDSFESPDGKDLQTAMPFSSSQLRDLQQATVALADAIDDAIGLISGAYEDTNDGGWEDDSADRFRASLVVGRTHASRLEDDVRTYARLLDDYAHTLATAQGYLDSSRRIADHAGLLDGTVVRQPVGGGIFDAGEGMLAEDELDDAFHRRREQATAFVSAREQFELAAQTVAQDSLAQFAEEIAEVAYFGAADFIRGEIEDVAKWYNQTNLPHPAFEIGRPSRVLDLLPKLPDGLALRAVRSHGGTAIEVFGVAFDIYTGVDPEEAVFLGIGSALGGAGGASTVKAGGEIAKFLAFRPAMWSPPGWALVLGASVGGWAGNQLASAIWDVWVPDSAKQWFEEQREEAREINEERSESKEWREAYREESDRPTWDLKSP